MQIKCHFVEFSNLTNLTPFLGLTPLMLAAIEKRNEYVEILLKYGANPNLRDDKSGRTALFHAVENDSTKIINMLLQHRADPKLNNFLGLCPIDAAVTATDKNLLSMEITTVQNEKTANPQKRVKKQAKGGEKKCRLSFVTSLQKIDSQNKKGLDKKKKRKED